MTNLEQAFAETGEQLDRIIDAYERKGPEPYVPTRFPTGIRFTDPKDNNSELLIKWISDSELQIINNTMDSDFNQTAAYIDHGDIGMRCYKTGFYFYLHGNDFSSVPSIVPSYFIYEWVDPSTLPQS